MRGGVALEEQNETKTAKQPVISGKVLWVALGACVVWLAAVGVMLIMKLTQPPLPPNMLDYTCELDVDIPAEPVAQEKKSRQYCLNTVRCMKKITIWQAG